MLQSKKREEKSPFVFTVPVSVRVAGGVVCLFHVGFA
jgi:hypothetical protein